MTYEFVGALRCELASTKIRLSDTDSTLLVTVGDAFGLARVMILNKEDKLAKGEGFGDAYMQNVAYYALFWATSSASVRAACACPSILIEQAAHEVSRNNNQNTFIYSK